MPGRGDQQAGRVLQLAERDFSGHVVLEVNSRKSGTRAQREADLPSRSLARLHLAAGSCLVRRGRRWSCQGAVAEQHGT